MKLLREYYVKCDKWTRLNDLVEALREYKELCESDKLEIVALMIAGRKSLVEAIDEWGNYYFTHTTSRTEYGEYLINELCVLGDLSKVKTPPDVEFDYEIKDFIDYKAFADVWIRDFGIQEIKFELDDCPQHIVYIERI